jgi:DNA-binding transcriptional MerR regulator
MITISRIAKQFNLSRSTLMYYDRIGLLRPSGRSPSNYRLYSEIDRQRLEQICHYRQMGLSLKAIQQMIDFPGSRMGDVLEQRLQEVDRQIQTLQNQQKVIRNLISNPSLTDKPGGLNRKKWTELLRAAGMSDQDMLQWHIEFERLFPHDHQTFLESLEIPPKDITAIRALSRENADASD